MASSAASVRSAPVRTLVQLGGQRLSRLQLGGQRVPGLGVALICRLRLEPRDLGAMALLGRGELGLQRPLRVGPHALQLGSQRLRGLRLDGRLCDLGRRFAVLRRLALETDDLVAMAVLDRVQLGGQGSLGLGSHPL